MDRDVAPVATISADILATTLLTVTATASSIPFEVSSAVPSGVTEIYITPTPTPSTTAPEAPQYTIDRGLLEVIYRELGGHGKIPFQKRSLQPIADAYAEASDDGALRHPHVLPGETLPDMQQRRAKEILQKYGMKGRSGRWRKKNFLREFQDHTRHRVDGASGGGLLTDGELRGGGDPDEAVGFDEVAAVTRAKLIEAGVPEKFARYIFPDEGEEIELPDVEDLAEDIAEVQSKDRDRSPSQKDEERKAACRTCEEYRKASSAERNRKSLKKAGATEEISSFIYPDEGEEVQRPDYDDYAGMQANLREKEDESLQKHDAEEEFQELWEKFQKENSLSGRRKLLEEHGVPDEVSQALFQGLKKNDKLRNDRPKKAKKPKRPKRLRKFKQGMSKEELARIQKKDEMAKIIQDLEEELLAAESPEERRKILRKKGVSKEFLNAMFGKSSPKKKKKNTA